MELFDINNKVNSIEHFRGGGNNSSGNNKSGSNNKSGGGKFNNNISSSISNQLNSKNIMTGGSFGGMGQYSNHINNSNTNKQNDFAMSNKYKYINPHTNQSKIINLDDKIAPNLSNKLNHQMSISGHNNIHNHNHNHNFKHKYNNYRSSNNYGNSGTFYNFDPWWLDYGYYYPYAPIYTPLLVNYPDNYTFPFIKETDVINNQNDNLIDINPYSENSNDNNLNLLTDVGLKQNIKNNNDNQDNEIENFGNLLINNNNIYNFRELLTFIVLIICFLFIMRN